MRSRSLLFALLFAAGCSQALADQPATPDSPVVGPRIAIATAPAKVRAPYDVEIMRDNGEVLPTYAAKDRYYVQGNIGERYIIKVTNPTDRRVEAVVTVDGLDVIDGQPGDLRKRGYVIPPHGSTEIEGFRTSTADVATFRFSSVDGSYAGEQGKARNVGVVAVAVFEEQARVEEQQIIVGDVDGEREGGEVVRNKRKYDYRDDLSEKSPPPPPTNGVANRPAETSVHGHISTADKPAAPSQPDSRGGYGEAQRRAPAPKDLKKEVDYDGVGGDDSGYGPSTTPRTERPGLGTEFGEQRSSAASYTRFVRAADRPIAIAELRYNDANGLEALGIRVTPRPDEGEIMTRETADPFPGDEHFARPVRR